MSKTQASTNRKTTRYTQENDVPGTILIMNQLLQGNVVIERCTLQGTYISNGSIALSLVKQQYDNIQHQYDNLQHKSQYTSQVTDISDDMSKT